jgi:hypothetical protein
MRPLRIPVLIASLIVLTVQVSAQTTGGTVLGPLADELRSSLTECNVLNVHDGLSVLDRSSGSVLLSIRQYSPEAVLFSATLGLVTGLEATARQELRRRLTHFNGSSPVGTAWYDEGAGVVVLSHWVNPARVPIASMVQVATLCSTASREGTALLVQ